MRKFDVAQTVNRTRRTDPKTLRPGFHRYFTCFGSPDGSASCETQPNCGTVDTIATARLPTLQCGNRHMSLALHPDSVL